MPTDLFMAYYDAMPRLRADRLLDAAEIAGLQHMAPDAVNAWYDRTLAMAVAVGGDTASTPSEPQPPSAFRLNGQPISPHALSQTLASVSGGGFAVQGRTA